MKEWILSVTYEVNGKGSFMVYYFDSEQECIDKAEQEWVEFYSIAASRKFFTANYKDKKGSVKKKVVCDSVGHCTVK